MDTQPMDVLLIEDNPDDAELTMHALARSQIACSVHVASDGEMALRLLNDHAPDTAHSPAHLPRVILLDLKLPRLSGLDVLAMLKSDPALSSIPVVILTSSREERDVVEGYRLGANSFVVKPVDYHEFISVIAGVGAYWTSLNQPLPSTLPAATTAPPGAAASDRTP